MADAYDASGDIGIKEIFDRDYQSKTGASCQNHEIPVVYFDNIQANLDAADFVEGLLIESSMAVVYGQSNSGKTFWVTDLALHLATGKSWNEREIVQGAVLWLAMEGSHGIFNRISAWRNEHLSDCSSAAFAVVPVSLNLLDPKADTGPLIDLIRMVSSKFELPVKLTVVDTLSRAMAGGNENGPDDMGALVTNGTRIQQETNSALLWIHHSGKDEAKGARGHSLLRAATDTEIEITASEDGSRSARVTKQRELDCGGEFQFSLKVRELGKNRRAKPVTSCVVVHSIGSAGAALPVTRLRGHAKRALEVLTNIVAASGKGGFSGVPSSVLSVPENWWRERFYEDSMPGEPQANKQKAFKRAAADLIERHVVGMASNRVWVVRFTDGECA